MRPVSERSRRITGTGVSPRPARSEDAILRAALDLLAEHGFAGLTVDAVAARAGVGKATIYRHWGSRARLVAFAAGCTDLDVDDADTGSLRGDLKVLLGRLITVLTEDDLGRVLPSMVDAAERDPELAAIRQEISCRKRELFEVAIRRAVERGEVVAGVDPALLTDVVVAPFFYRRLVSRTPLRRDDIDPLLDLVLAAVGVSEPVATSAS